MKFVGELLKVRMIFIISWKLLKVLQGSHDLHNIAIFIISWKLLKARGSKLRAAAGHASRTDILARPRT
jgi:hypothetical protein